jgi:hypothetical protein
MSYEAITPEQRRQFDRTYPQLLAVLEDVAKQWKVDADPGEIDRGIVVAFAAVWGFDEGYDAWLPMIVNRRGERVDVQMEASNRFGMVVGDEVISGSGIMPLPEFEAKIIKKARKKFSKVLEGRSDLDVKIMQAPYVSSVSIKGVEELVAHLRMLISQSDAEDLDQSTQSALGSSPASRL